MSNTAIPSVARTYRAAVKIGDDYITLEETVTLPIDADDAAIAAAVDLSLRIYRAQRAAVEAQVVHLRETRPVPTASPITVRDPDAPASEKQRNFLATLQDTLGWSSDRLAAAATAIGADLTTLTKAQASTLIEQLKQLSDTHQAAEPATPPVPPATPAEAAARFFTRYGDRIGGTDWSAVQRFLRRRMPAPQTIDDWFQAARSVREHRTA